MLCVLSVSEAGQTQTILARGRETGRAQHDMPGERQQSGFGALRCLFQLMQTKPQELIIAQRAVGKR